MMTPMIMQALNAYEAESTKNGTTNPNWSTISPDTPAPISVIMLQLPISIEFIVISSFLGTIAGISSPRAWRKTSG